MAETGGEQPAGEGLAVPEAGLVNVGGEERIDGGGMKGLRGRVGVGLTVGGQQGERAEGAEFNLYLPAAGVQKQGGESVGTGRVVQASQAAELT